eukprot:5010495-Pyramimonas_sp.AAC.1
MHGVKLDSWNWSDPNFETHLSACWSPPPADHFQTFDRYPIAKLISHTLSKVADCVDERTQYWSSVVSRSRDQVETWTPTWRPEADKLLDEPPSEVCRALLTSENLDPLAKESK